MVENIEIGDYVIELSDLISPIGRGAFGYIYLCKKKGEGEKNYVAKQFIENSANIIERLKKAANILKIMDSKYLLKYICFSEYSGKYYLISKYCNSGTLDEYIKKKHFMEFPLILKLFSNIAHGIEELHKKKLIYFNINVDDIFLHKEESGMIAVISNWLFAQEKIDYIDQGAVLGYPPTISPEESDCGYISFPADIWSMGCVLYKMIFSQYPFAGNYINTLLRKGKYTLLSGFFLTVESIDLIEFCLQKYPDKRASAVDVCNHAFLKLDLSKQTFIFLNKEIVLCTSERKFIFNYQRKFYSGIVKLN